MNTKAGRLMESALQLINEATIYLPDSYQAKRLTGEFWTAYGRLELDEAMNAVQSLTLLVETAKSLEKSEEQNSYRQ